MNMLGHTNRKLKNRRVIPKKKVDYGFFYWKKKPENHYIGFKNYKTRIHTSASSYLESRVGGTYFRLSPLGRRFLTRSLLPAPLPSPGVSSEASVEIDLDVDTSSSSSWKKKWLWLNNVGKCPTKDWFQKTPKQMKDSRNVICKIL